MTSRTKLFTALALGAFVALLIYNTLSAQKVECTVCVEFNGKQNCATASHASEDEAKRSAQNTACGILASGMNESLACDRTPPISAQCRTR